MKEYKETHQQGILSFEKDISKGYIEGDIGIQIAKDGRIWICIDSEAVIRFKPNIKSHILAKEYFSKNSPNKKE